MNKTQLEKHGTFILDDDGDELYTPNPEFKGDFRRHLYKQAVALGYGAGCDINRALEVLEMITTDVASIAPVRLLGDYLDSQWGSEVTFNNGCYLDLQNDNGLIWGASPYGVEWACNCDVNWKKAVSKWLAYWDAPRDECGKLIDVDE